MTKSDRSVLVIDPDPAVRALLLAVVRRQGFLAEGTDDADDALRRCRTGRHAAVIVDPRILGGVSLLNALDGASPDGTNLIVVTTPDAFEAPYNHGHVREVLFKPFHIDDLAAAVARCCGS
jgi:DNA-binding NtrC family response regulator